VIDHDGSSLAGQAYDHIRTRLISGAWPPRARLVTRRIATELGVSLNPVREALGRLAAEGLVEHVPGAGSFVPSLEPQEVGELYEYREAVEPFAARKAARAIRPSELGLLSDLCDRQLTLARGLRGSPPLHGADLDAWLACEERFHEILIRAARNRFLDAALERSRVLTRLFGAHRDLGVAVDLSAAARTWRSHRRIVAALARGDGDAAARHVHVALTAGARMALGS
jgi:DNA-binding GntR family transcriptional regulator